MPGAEERLYNDLKWAGIKWDEGMHSVYNSHSVVDRARSFDWWSSWALSTGEIE